MNSLLIGEQQTKTIKYLNRHQAIEDQDSQSITEKQYEQELLQIKKKIDYHKLQIQPHFDSRAPVNKIMVIESLEQVSNGRWDGKNLVNPSKNKHIKGKSMDLEQQRNISKEDKKNRIIHGNSSKNNVKNNNKHFINDFCERKSISEMKQYTNSKNKAVKYIKQGINANFKRNKSKSNQDGQIKQQRLKIQSIYSPNEINIHIKKREALPKRKKSNGSSTSRGMKVYSKSYEIPSQKKVRTTNKQKYNSVDLKNIAQTMPLTSKMVSLYSNSSSVFSCQQDQQKLYRRHSYIIPTQESTVELHEIRRYESTMSRRGSSENLKHMKKFSFINHLQQDTIKKGQQQTAKIINNLLQQLKDNELLFQNPILNGDQDQISQIPFENVHKNKQNSQFMLGSLNLADLHDLSQYQEVKIENSIVLNDGNIEIANHQNQLTKLNEIIEIIRKKSQNNDNNNEVVLQKIKLLIQKNPERKQLELSRKDTSMNEISGSQLKQSMGSEQNIEHVNLQMLDKTLRQRQAYLITRKQKELQRLEQNKQIDKQHFEIEKRNIIKWMDHQIKQVVHTRKQLWKGFNIANNLLAEQNSQSEKKQEMMKCLSEKYIFRETPRKPKRQKQAGLELSKARVNKLNRSHSDSQSSQVNIQLNNSSDPSQQLLLTSNKTGFQYSEFPKELIKDLQPSDQEKGQKQLEQSELLQSSGEMAVGLKQSQRLEIPVSTLPQTNKSLLNLQQIQCQIQHEDSFNEQQLNNLVKQSQEAKNKSILQNLSPEDKQDIYEFIFLDLCIQLTDQYGQNSTIMKKLFSFIKNLKEQAKKQKGFKTNTNAVKDYLYQFISYLKNKPEYLDQLHSNIDKPLGPTAIDILKYMHVYEEQVIQDQSNETVFILDIKLFQIFQQVFLGKVEFEKYYEDQQKEKKRKIFLKNAIHIHNKAIFDALNQTLDRQRPFGVWGEPFSWKKTAKFYHQRNTLTKNNIILKSAQKTIQYGAYMCGFILDKEDCNLKDNPNVTQAYIDSIRDDRLSRMLANQLQQSEEKMLFIDDEETQILVEIGQIILQLLIAQVSYEFSSLI